MTPEHHAECERFRSRDDYYPCICPQLEFVAGRAVVLAMDDLHDKVEALPQPKVAGVLFVVDDVVSRADVLALLNGVRDD